MTEGHFQNKYLFLIFSYFNFLLCNKADDECNLYKHISSVLLIRQTVLLFIIILSSFSILVIKIIKFLNTLNI